MKVVDRSMIGKKLSRLLRRANPRKIVITKAPIGLWRVLRRPVAGGEEIVIARTGVTVAGLVSHARQEPRRPGLAPGRLTEALFDPLPEDELAAWEQ